MKRIRFLSVILLLILLVPLLSLTASAEADGVIYLSDLENVSHVLIFSQGISDVINQGLQQKRMSVGGRAFRKGFCTHPVGPDDPSVITVDVSAYSTDYPVFHTVMGKDDITKDGGWYFKSGTESLKDWTATGTWMVDTKRFPTKLRAISDKAHENNMKTLLWFEPEVVRIPEEQRDKEYGIPLEYMLCPVLADFGNPGFVDWVLERVTKIITEGGISLYRQDYGIDPLYYFNQTNKKGRTGIRENLYAQGYYTYWDKLIERFPSMMIDSCAAGGGRNDIESMRRAVPIHKTDHDYSNTSDKQSMHQALFNWFPYFGTNLTGNVVDLYIMRTNYTPWVNLNLNINSKILKWSTVSGSMYEWQTVAKYYYCDYYELTEWADGDAAWRGWEFFSPEDNEGFIQMFRPKDAADEVYRIKMKGLDETAVYRVRNADTGVTIVKTGKSLMEEGFDSELSPRSAALYKFEKNN